PLANDDTEKVNQEDQEVFDQPFSTWHRENKNSDRKQNFLQFELDVGTKTEILGGGARETEEGDQALANIQGDSQQSEDRKSTRLNSSHVSISYAVFCLKKKNYKSIASIQQSTESDSKGVNGRAGKQRTTPGNPGITSASPLRRSPTAHAGTTSAESNMS